MCPSSYGPDCVSAINPRLNYMSQAPYYPITSSYVGYDPLSFDCSVYGDGYGLTPNYGYGYGTGGYGGYAYNGGMYSPDAMFENMDKWTDYMYDRNVKYIEKSRANQMRINGTTDAARYAADQLTEKIQKNNQNHILQAFEQYKAAVRQIYPEYANLSDKELSAKAMDLYQQRTGISLKDSIRANGNSMITQGFLNGLTCFIGYEGSAEHTISKMTGAPVDREDRIMHSIGQGAGFATLAVGTTAVAKHGFKNIGSIWKGVKAGPLAAVGLLVAAGTAIFGFFNKD